MSIEWNLSAPLAFIAGLAIGHLGTWPADPWGWFGMGIFAAFWGFTFVKDDQ